MNEIWKPVKGFEGFYEISNLGRLKGIKMNKIHAVCLDSDGYPHTTLCRNGDRKCTTIHKLVAIAFVPNPNNYTCVNHKDEIKTNNCADNLEWCTVKYNNNYGTKNLRAAKKREKPVVQVLNGEAVETYQSAKEASQKTGVNYWHICECCRETGRRKRAGGYNWKYAKK